MFSYVPKRDGDDIKDLFNILYKDVKFDRKLYKQLKRFRLEWSRKNIEYSEFLGGNSLGLQTIRFSSRDDEMLMSSIYNVGHTTVYSNLIRLPDMDSKWNVATNPILQTLTYTMHRFIIDGNLGSKLEDALRECYYIFAYKIFGSLLSHYFKYNTTPALAKATYERLSNRFLIKRLGTWNKVLEHRALDVIPNKGLHSDRLKSYTTDDAVRVTNDLQGRIRETIKNIYVVWLSVIEDNAGVKTTSTVTKNDTEESTVDITNRPDKFVNRAHELIGNQINLIDSDIVYLVTQFIKASDQDVIKDTLRYLSDDYNPKSKDSMYLEHVIVKTIAYINTKGVTGDYKSNIIDIITYMKGYWASGSVNDKDVKKVRHIIETAVKRSTKKKTKWVIAANTLATIVYLFIRVIK